MKSIKRRLTVCAIVLLQMLLCGSAAAQVLYRVPWSGGEPSIKEMHHVRFGRWFSDATMRLDCLREGNHDTDRVTIVRYTPQLPSWTGRRGKHAIDPIQTGRYRVLVVDDKSNRLLYATTYNSLFAEYRDLPQACTTAAGEGIKDTFEEVLYLPMPKRSARIYFQQRVEADALNYHTQSCYRWLPQATATAIQTVPVRPLPATSQRHRALHHSGNPREKMDIVIVPEGYGPQDSLKMERDLEYFATCALGKEPFRGQAHHINIYGVEVLGQESGITNPKQHLQVHSAVGSSYGTFGSDRYLMTRQLFRLHDLLTHIPCDHIIIMANSDTYGGGGIYNFYTMSAVQSMSEWILPHELGHSIGGLADEYVDSDTNFSNMHPRTVEPVEANITTLVNFSAKWQHMLPSHTPVPTSIPSQSLPKDQCGPIGVYEGAGYVPKGVYRPTPHCMMRDYHPFCPVCTRRLQAVIATYTH